MYRAMHGNQWAEMSDSDDEPQGLQPMQGTTPIRLQPGPPPGPPPQLFGAAREEPLVPPGKLCVVFFVGLATI
jgi:hypothetical protein